VRVAVDVRVVLRLAVAVRVGSTAASKRMRGGPGASKKDSQPVWTEASRGGGKAPIAPRKASRLTARRIPYSG